MLPLLTAAWIFVAAAAAPEGARSNGGIAQRASVPQRSAADASAFRDEQFKSAALGRAMKYRVLLPRDYERSTTRYRVLFLLHGLTGDYTDWSTRTDIARMARDLPLVIAMPAGENSWYTNAADGGARFEDYVAEDLVKDVEEKFRVIRARGGRALAGLSMGGYGALKIALKRPGTFAVAGSFSGALSIASDPAYADHFPAYKAEILRIFGAAGSPTRIANDVFAIADRAPGASEPLLYLDTGTADTLALLPSRALAGLLQRRGYRHEYHELPGAHSWDYWNRRIEYFLPWLMKAFGETRLIRGADHAK